MSFPQEQLEDLERRGLLRKLKTGNRQLINFSSNDYLNLSGNPRVKESAIRAIELYGTGSGGSRLMAGNLELHHTLEDKLAEITGMDSSLVFGSGYLANLGVLTTVAGRNDVIFSDRLNHSSLVAGAQASRAEVRRYRHCDTGHLSEMLEGHSTPGRKIIVTDSLFSMDGHMAPLSHLFELSEKHGCFLVVDEAHAIGVYGKGGGICRSLGLKPDILTGTLSKALGSYGGFAACSTKFREYLINSSKTFIYSTGLPPGSVGAALASLEILEEEPLIGEKLLRTSARFRTSLENLGGCTGNSCSQIVPLIMGEPLRALEFSASLEKASILTSAIRPPTVPAGTSRIRFSITLAHTEEDIGKTLALMGDLL